MTTTLTIDETAIILAALIIIGELSVIASELTGSIGHSLLAVLSYGLGIALIFSIAWGRIELDRETGVLANL